jgi:predicted AlkP superfamily phosphohydrolase/phosphomutase
VFLNVKGREPEGIIEPSEFERERDELAERLKSICDPNERRMETQVHKPEELFQVSVGDRPDLMVYFDDLFWRSAGTLGHSDIYLSENDTGPDDAVHSQYGIFILHDRQLAQTGPIPDVDILDVAPTLLRRLNLPVPSSMEGVQIKLGETE